MTTPTYADRVQETFTTTGTGPVSLAGAITGYQSFSAVMANSGACYYCMTDGTNWEIGLGTYTTSGNTLTRTTVTASSNAGAAVNWAAGTKSVWLDLAASAIANFTTPPAATAGSLGLVQPDGAIITVSGGAITVAVGSSSAFGVVKTDGSTVLASGGVISVPTANSSSFGLVKPDNSTVTISGGVLSASPGGGGGGGGGTVTPLTIGAYIMGGLASGFGGSTLAAGLTVSGSILTPGVVSVSGTTATINSGIDTLSGTWKLQYGYVNNGNTTPPSVGLWQRIA